MRTATAAMVLAISLALCGGAARSSPAGCQKAQEQYNAAVHNVREALRGYGHCVADSGGHDDCTIEFSTLQAAQDDFATAALHYQTVCS